MGVHKLAEPPLETSLATMLDVLAWEIELAGARCVSLDAIVGELMPALPPAQRQRLTEGMHVVDLLAQHLTCLSAFARRLSEDAPAAATVPVTDALAGITLGALADRMASAFGREETAEEPVEAGDPDFF
ncbi:MAG: hypothetical protein ACK4YQ_05160 [Phenylobacterium sp.]|uniref:hypothetical protein n=1 Tax=Phenylobacterium sp. TaxID=1871053 RepID=UPI0039195E93